MEENAVTTDAQVDQSPLIDVDPPAPAAEAQKTDGDTEQGETAQETTEQVEEKKQSKFQRRLERQKTARIQAETRAQIAEERLAKLEAQSQANPEPGEPKREQFEDYESYLRAATRYEAQKVTDERLQAARQESQRAQQEGRRSEGQAQVAQEWVKREAEFIKTTPDYLETVTPFVEEELGSLSMPARQAIVELGPEILFKLATDTTGLVDKIAAMSPVRQVAELGKLDKAADVPTPKRESSAPAPITPNRSSTTPVKSFRENGSQSDYRAFAKAHGSKWVR